MALFIKNNTGVNKIWAGVVITPSEYYLIEPEEINVWSFDEDIKNAIIIGDALVARSNDGTQDLTNNAIGLSALNSFSSGFESLQSFIFCRNGEVIDSWLFSGDGAPSNNSPLIVVNDSVLHSIVYSNKRDNSDCKLRFKVNGTTAYTWQIRSTRHGINTGGSDANTSEFGNLIINAGDTIGIKIKDNAAFVVKPKDVIVQVNLKNTSLKKQVLVSSTL